MSQSGSDMNGKVGFITGGGRGIGFGVAKQLAQRGANLAINDFDRDRLETAAKELRAFGNKVSTHLGDVTQPPAVHDMIAAVEKEHGRIDLLLNNVGLAPPGVKWTEFLRQTLDDFRAIVDQNLMTQVIVLKEVLPGMVERGYGKIVCISSIAGVVGHEGGSAYAAGKAGVNGLVKSLSKEVARYGITINAIVVGNAPSPKRAPERQKQLDELSHFGRGGTFEEFGKAIAFYLSDDSSYCTGALVPVDGGVLAPRTAGEVR